MEIINILFLTIGKFNDVNERGIYTDLVRKFNENGHKVFVVSPIERREKKKTHLLEENGISLLRVRTGNLKKNNLLEKGINTILIENLYKRAIKKFYKGIKFDLILYSTPPITFANVIEFVKKRDSAKTYLLLKDIFPQNAVDLNIIKKNGAFHRMFMKKEKHLYLISDYIGCMSTANLEYILENNKYLNPDKVEVNPNSISPISFENNNQSIHERYKLPKDRIKFIYGGNLGEPQGIPFLLECLKANRNNEKVHFIIVGSGAKEKLINEYVNNKSNSNITFIKYLPKNEYDSLISIADVGMIFLDSKFTIPNFPSRLLSYMEVGLPVLTATDEATDIGDIVAANGFGYKSISNNVENFNSILPKFYSNLERKRMGENSRLFLYENYTVDKSYSMIMNHFN